VQEFAAGYGGHPAPGPESFVGAHNSRIRILTASVQNLLKNLLGGRIDDANGLPVGLARPFSPDPVLLHGLFVSFLYCILFQSYCQLFEGEA